MKALAVDVGASGGKAVVGRFDGERLAVEEIHRFPNDPVRVGPRLHWDILRLYHELKQSLLRARHADAGIESVGIDTWGLDFGLLGRRGELLGNPYHYRDRHTAGAMDEVLAIVPRDELFARTGIQFVPINTLYQLYALKRANSPLLDQAETLLMIPELLRYFLTGERQSEETIASTTQLLALRTRDWDRSLLDRLGLPSALLRPVLPPGSLAGRLGPEVTEELGVPPLPVVAVGEHDTASAVAAVPASGDFAYVSCGTWALLGTELSAPVADDRALAWNFTNERGLAGTFRLLKNITGLWLVEACRHAWATEGTRLSHEELTAAAAAAPPFAALVDPDAPVFLNPPHMPRQIQAACRESGQPVPEERGAILRCIHESLALKFRLILEQTEALSGRRFGGLHIVGGGSNNALLCQLTADAIGRPVWAGPAEATAIGNLLAQYMAAGRIGSLQEGRAIVRASVPVTTYEPRRTLPWDEVFGRFLAMIGEGRATGAE